MKFVCSVCGYVYEGDTVPAECPVCHAGSDKFVSSGQMTRTMGCRTCCRCCKGRKRRYSF